MTTERARDIRDEEQADEWYEEYRDAHGWPELEEAQRMERSKQEIAMRNGHLRGLPTVFGEMP